MAVLPWARAHARAAAGTLVTPGDSMRAVALRLAAQTVLLLLVMLIVLEVAVFVITEHALLGTLRTALRDRAATPPAFICALYHPACGGSRGFGGAAGPGAVPAPGGKPGGGLEGHPGDEVRDNPSDASRVFLDTHLDVLHADGQLGAIIPVPADARAVMQDGKPRCCSVSSLGEARLLVYTAPVWFDGHLVGAVQTSISEDQYRHTMSSLLQVLIAVALLGLLISSGVSIFLVGRALEPIRVAVQRQRDFVADAAHELRTPLAIQRTVGEVSMAGEADDLPSAVAQMLGQNHHLTRLVDDLSLLARADTGTVSIDRSPLDLSALVRDTSSEIGYLAEEQGIALRAAVQPDVRVLGDTVRLRQLLLILLDNALKHTPEGGRVDVSLTITGGRARLQVADSGSGINPVDLPRIFDRFYRADQARSSEGTGLGLSIGRWIVEAHGGHITADNAPGAGALFTVTLPTAKGAAVR